MTIQTLYPVFESGQVLTEAALNTIIAYLEPQDRLSRSRLTGIGICCGLEPELGEGGQSVRLGKGVAVTSEGYLIAQGDMRYVQRRRYQAPVPNGNATVEEMTRARYPFLFDGAVQREAWELLEAGAEQVAGAPPPVPLDAAFLADRVVMLFLEERRDALKNCDVNDCSDKGAQLQLTLRALLISRAVADTILAQEQALVPDVPVDRSRHPRLGLKRIEVPRLLPAGIVDLTYPNLFARQMEIALDGLLDAATEIGAAQRAYGAALSPDFDPAGPLRSLLLPLPGHWAMMPVLAQTLMLGVQDLALALDEALAAGAVLDAECLPDDRRFPRHVLAGRVVPSDPPFAKGPGDFAALAGFDPSRIEQGPRAGMPPAPYRHHFIPAPPLAPHAALRFRTLWHRLHLMALSYHASDLVGADIRLSPSRGAADLGDRAIPAHYKVAVTSTLVANWSFERRQNPSAPGPVGYRLLPAAGSHPLLRTDEAVDFIRIEGVVGRPLADAWATILTQKRDLGLGFAIQPVLALLGDDSDKEEIATAQGVFGRLLSCQTQDLASQLQVASAGLRPFLLWLMRSLASVEAGTSVRVPGAQPVAVADGLGFAVLALSPDVQASIQKMDAGLGRGLAAAPEGRSVSTRRVLEAAEIQIAPAAGSVLGLTEALQAQGAGTDALEGLVRINRAQGLGRADAQNRALAALPSVSLLQRTEAVLDALGRAEIGTLATSDLDRRINALLQDFDAYVEQAETDPERAGVATAQVNREIIASKATLAALAAPLGGKALAAEAEQRLAQALNDMILPRFATRYPALDHRGGTPATGTFVLLVCHRQMVERMVKAGVASARRQFDGVWRRLFGGDTPVPDLDAALAALGRAAQPQSDHPLNSYVVLADLCLPTQCCEALCSEDEIAKLLKGVRPIPTPRPPPRPEPPFDPIRPAPVDPEPVRPVEPTPDRPIGPEPPNRRLGTLQGRVLRRTRSVVDAEVVLREIDGDARFRTVSQARGSYQIEVPEGRYTVVAQSGDVTSEPVEIIVRAGEEEQLDLQLAR